MVRRAVALTLAILLGTGLAVNAGMAETDRKVLVAQLWRVLLKDHWASGTAISRTIFTERVKQEFRRHDDPSRGVVVSYCTGLCWPALEVKEIEVSIHAGAGG